MKTHTRRYLDVLLCAVLLFASVMVAAVGGGSRVAWAGGAFTVEVRSTPGAAGSATSDLTGFAADLRQFQFTGMTAGDAVSIETSNDAVSFQRLYLASGVQSGPLRFADRARFYRTTRIGGVDAVTLTVTAGTDRGYSGLPAIRYSLPSLAASNAACVPMFTAIDSDLALGTPIFTGSVTEGIDALNYELLTFHAYDSAGNDAGTLGSWATNSVVAVTARVGTAIPFVTPTTLIPLGYSVCYVVTRNGTGTLAQGSLEFPLRQ